MALLEVRDLRTALRHRRRRASPRSTASASTVEAGRTLAIVGESGCGKSVTALSIMGLVPSPPGRIAGGSIRFEGRELVGAAGKRELQDLRGNGMAMIFQEPMIVAEPGLHHRRPDRRGPAAAPRASAAPRRPSARIEMLRKVRIPAPEQRFHEYPHKLSGGMRQRAMIAMALACEPRLLIADEPTTALDVTIQAQILELMRTLQQETGTAVILITHDLGVVAEVADEVAVMYCRPHRRAGAGARAVRRAAASRTPSACSARSRGSTCERGAAGLDRGPGARPAAPPGRLPLRRPLPLRRSRRCRAEEPPLRDVGAGAPCRPAGARRSTRTLLVAAARAEAVAA